MVPTTYEDDDDRREVTPAEPAEGVTGPEDMRLDPAAQALRDSHDDTRQETELQRERDERRERLGQTGPAAGARPVPHGLGAPSTTPPDEPATFDPAAGEATEDVADYGAEESNKKE